MLFQRFFKQPKPNKFGYTPVYYDARKEDRDRKIREANREREKKERGETDYFRNKLEKDIALKRNSSLNKFRAKENSKSNRTLLIILFIIAAIIYVQLKY